MLEMSRYAALARQAVAEGIVLLKNEAVLPLASGGRAALFGYAQFHYYQSGTGSGGLVNTAHVPNLPEVLGGPDGYQLDAEVQARYAAWMAEHPYEMGTGWPALITMPSSYRKSWSLWYLVTLKSSALTSVR